MYDVDEGSDWNAGFVEKDENRNGLTDVYDGGRTTGE